MTDDIKNLYRRMLHGDPLTNSFGMNLVNYFKPLLHIYIYNVFILFSNDRFSHLELMENFVSYFVMFSNSKFL